MINFKILFYNPERDLKVNMYCKAEPVATGKTIFKIQTEFPFK